MTPRHPDPVPTVVWERPEPGPRPVPSPLSRDRIVAAALALADRDGLDAVSLRKVAAALDAGPMRLYGYLDSKDELLDLVVDAVYGEMATPSGEPGDWRAALSFLAHETRAAALRHPWFADLIGGRPQLGPAMLAHLEASLAALATVTADVEVVLAGVRAVNAYVVGAVRGEAAEQRAVRSGGPDQQQWQRAASAYLERMLATGRFPTVVRFVEHPEADPETVFAAGLDLVLVGIAGRLPTATKAVAEPPGGTGQTVTY